MSGRSKCIFKPFCQSPGPACSSFKDKENLVEVVRCKDCKHKVRTSDGEYNPEDIVCDYHMSDGFNENDYCSYGEREDKP